MRLPFGTGCCSVRCWLIAVHGVLVSWCAARYGFAWTEVGLLPAGILDWHYGTFDVYRVNPPLVRMWGTLPVLALEPEIPFHGVLSEPRSRAEWEVARAMFDADPDAAHLWLRIARLFCLPFAAVGMWVASRWASELYGRAAGIGAAVLWAFLPNLIGYGCLISGDAQAASMGLLTFYLFRSWLARPRFAESYLLGLVWGLTILTKSSWLILLGMLPVLWLSIRTAEWWKRHREGRSPCLAQLRNAGSAFMKEAVLLAFALLLALFVVNLLYGFSGSFRRLDSYDFISKALAGNEDWQSHGWSGNRFHGTALGAVPVPLPGNLVTGIDLQKWDFDRERWSYFRGEWRTKGWWYYYLYGLATKLPLGFWLLFLIAAAGMVWRRSWRGPWQQELLLWTPMVLVVGGASVETGLNRHLRYVLPALPFAIVLASRSFRLFCEPSRIGRGTVTVATAWMVASSLWIYPHSLSYFNESVGGPMRADAHFNASNLDWGQDLPYLRRWQQANPKKRPMWVRYTPFTPPDAVGVESEGRVPSMGQPDHDRRLTVPAETDPLFLPGWYAIDRESLLRRSGEYDYLRSLQPAAWAGYGFYIYEISPVQAEAFEQQLRGSARR